MKKATSKRERKYGKKNDNDIKIKKAEPEKIVRLMVDYGTIVKFKNKSEADSFIKKHNEEADRKGLPKPHFVIM